MSSSIIHSKEITCGELTLTINKLSTSHTPSEALSYFDNEDVFYFRNKEQSFEICAFGVTKKNLTKTQCTNLLKLKNENLYILGARGFYDYNTSVQELAPENEWNDFDYSFYIPNYIFLREADVVSLLSISIKGQELEELEELASLKESPNNIPNTLNKTFEITNKEQWTKQVIESKKEMAKREIQKIVLCRKIKHLYSRSIDHIQYFNNLRESFSNSYQIYYKNKTQVFVSLTPETLYRIDAEKLEIDCIAGTIKKSEIESEARNSRELFKKDQKELEEHRIVCQSVEEILKSHDIVPQYEFKERILSLKHVEHMHSKISTTLTRNEEIEILEDLHPTPAVGGRPKSKALELIKEIEKDNRALYAAPIGFFNSNKSEFAVGIRSALINDNQMFLYGGCGIVKDSDPDKEWIETQTKMKNFL